MHKRYQSTKDLKDKRGQHCQGADTCQCEGEEKGGGLGPGGLSLL